MPQSYIPRTAVGAAISLTLLSGHAYAHVCDNPRAAARNEVTAAYDAKIVEVKSGIDQVGAMPAGPIKDALLTTLRQTLGALETHKEVTLQNTDDQVVSACTEQLKGVQAIMDGAVVAATGGVSLLLPKNMLHIDMGEILDGHLFGGKGSFFHKTLGLPW